MVRSGLFLFISPLLVFSTRALSWGAEEASRMDKVIQNLCPIQIKKEDNWKEKRVDTQ